MMKVLQSKAENWHIYSSTEFPLSYPVFMLFRYLLHKQNHLVQMSFYLFLASRLRMSP